MKVADPLNASDGDDQLEGRSGIFSGRCCVDGPSCGEYGWNAAGPCKDGDGIGDDQTDEECNYADVLSPCCVSVAGDQSSSRTLNPGCTFCALAGPFSRDEQARSVIGGLL